MQHASQQVKTHRREKMPTKDNRLLAAITAPLFPLPAVLDQGRHRDNEEAREKSITTPGGDYGWSDWPGSARTGRRRSCRWTRAGPGHIDFRPER